MWLKVIQRKRTIVSSNLLKGFLFKETHSVLLQSNLYKYEYITCYIRINVHFQTNETHKITKIFSTNLLPSP